MARLFKRGATLTLVQVTRDFSDRKFGLDGLFPTFKPVTTTTTNSVTVRDLRISFEIEKTLEKEPNSCTISVFNLSKTTRQFLQGKPIHVQLSVGYDGLLEQVFAGDVRWADSRRDSVDWETRLQLGDGDRAFRFARVSRSFKGGVTVKTALNEAAKAMGLTLPNNVTDSEIAGEFVSGLSLHGSASSELTRLLTPLGLGWSIQDGRLQILNEQTARSGEALVISPDSGMIGSPEYGTPEEAGTRKRPKPPILTFRSLLRPALIPGGLVKLESASVNGVFKALRVRHSGDTHGKDWTSEVECRQV